MYDLLVTPNADDDIMEIYAYLLDNAGERIANAVRDNIYETFALLQITPLQGKRVHSQSQYRKRPGTKNAKSWVVYYNFDGSTLTILGVIRGERQTRRDEFGDRGF